MGKNLENLNRVAWC